MFDTKHIGRAEVLDGFNAFTIEIPAQRSWFKIIFLCVWLCGWLAGELFAVFTLFNGPEDGFTIVFLSVWLLGWTFGGIAAFMSVLFQLVGKDRFVLDRTELSIERTVFGMGRKRKYNVDLIKHIQYNNQPSLTGIFRKIAMNDPKFFKGFIAFEYKGRKIFWGKGLSEITSKELFEDIQNTSFLDKNQFTEI